MLELRTLILACVVTFCAAGPTLAAESLLRVGQPPVDATFVSARNDGTLQFRVADVERNVTPRELVRWSSARTNSDRGEVLLRDGSRLVLAEAWVEEASWQMEDDKISIVSSLLGHLDLRRDQVRAILLSAPGDLQQRARLLDQMLEKQQQTDCLRLSNGDQWQGRLIGPSNDRSIQRSIQWRLESGDQPVEFPERRVVSITLGDSESLPVDLKNPGQQEKLVVGLRDGSLLIAESLIADGKQLRIRLAGGIEVSGSDQRDVVYLRSLSAACSYLSDRPAVEYQHVPYLEIPWPYHRDRNVLGGPLRAQGHSYAKGLGMHTAARLTYRLDSAETANRPQQFIASIAVDAEAGRRGSVIFRVYLEVDGEWQLAYASPIIRGGDPSVPISVKLGDATQLALVTDFADRGDELDYANWLEARLE